MKKRALILYVSLTGNTEKIANAFKGKILAEGWQCDMVKITNKTDFHKDPVYFDDYDLVMLGSPIMAGLPSTWLGKNLGLTASMPPQMYHNQSIMPGLMRAAKDEAPYAVVFATYAGSDAGPAECVATLEIESLYLKNLYCTVIGRFATPGGEYHHASVDTVADKLGLDVDLASDILARFKENPDAEEFAKMPPHKLGELKKAAGMGEQGPIHQPKEQKEMDPEKFQAMMAAHGRNCGGHYDINNRPNQRDFLKAEIFIEELLRDNFTEQGRRLFGGEYISIS